MPLALVVAGTRRRRSICSHDLSQNYGFTYMAAGIYYVFGQFAPLVSYFNCVVGTITVFHGLSPGAAFFHTLVARRAALLMALMPSMILWSSIALKDALMSLPHPGRAVVVRLAEASLLDLRPSLGIVVSMVAIQPVRFYMVYFLGFAISSRSSSNAAWARHRRLQAARHRGVFAGLLVMVGLCRPLHRRASS